MKDRLYYYAFKLGKTSIGSKVLKAYYKLAIYTLKHKLKQIEWIYSAHLKGSFLNETFLLGVSDLDFFLIGDVTDDHRKYLEKLFARVHILFPMVSDFDFHNKEDAEFLFKFGGAKFFFQSEWVPIKGNSVDLNYLFHPLKFYLDVIQEIYFQLEYLMFNLHSSEIRTVYRTIVIERQYHKILDLLNRVVAFDSRKSWPNHEYLTSTRWKYLTNEEIINKFNKVIENHSFSKWFSLWLKEHIPSSYLEESLGTSFFKQRIHIFNTGFTYDSFKLYLTRNNLELFYYTGCIDSSVLWKYTREITNENITNIISLKYYSHLLEGYPNYLHDLNFYYFNRKNILNLAANVTAKEFLTKPTTLYKKDVVFIFGDPLTKIIDNRFTFIYVQNNEGYSEACLSNVQIHDGILNQISKEIFKLVGFWGIGANYITVIQANYVSKDNLDLIFNSNDSSILTNESEEVIGFRSNIDQMAKLSKELFKYSSTFSVVDLSLKKDILQNKYGIHFSPDQKNSLEENSLNKTILNSTEKLLNLRTFYPSFFDVDKMEITVRQKLISSINYAIKNSATEEDLFYALEDLFERNNVSSELKALTINKNEFYVLGRHLVLDGDQYEVLIRPTEKEFQLIKFLELQKDTYYFVEIKFGGTFSENDSLLLEVENIENAHSIFKKTYQGKSIYYISYWLRTETTHDYMMTFNINASSREERGVQSLSMSPYTVETFFSKLTNKVQSIDLYTGVYKIVIYHKENLEIHVYDSCGSTVLSEVSTSSNHVFFMEIMTNDNYQFSMNGNFDYIDVLKLDPSE